jgi:CheY-like chemotaxis protein
VSAVESATEDPPPIALIVDDTARDRNIARRMLKRLGWDALPVLSGTAAIEQLRHRRFDLVLLDLSLPGLSGEETCARIRNELALADLPVVACTTQSMPDESAQLIAGGFDGVLVKPLSFDDVRRLCVELGHAGRA